MGGGFGGLYTALRLESLVWPDDKKPQVIHLLKRSYISVEFLIFFSHKTSLVLHFQVCLVLDFASDYVMTIRT